MAKTRLPDTHIEKSRLRKELALLFSEDTVQDSLSMTADQVMQQAGAVAQGARRLNEHQGDPAAQRRVIEEMGTEPAMALCRWIQAV